VPADFNNLQVTARKARRKIAFGKSKTMYNQPAKKVHIITLGCHKNLVDSEVLMKQLQADGFAVSHNPSSVRSGIVIINTCGFINDAKEESIETILRFARARKEGSIEKLLVTGCLSQRFKEELRIEIPEVDQYFGTADLKAILKEMQAKYRKEILGERLLATPSHYAYLKIAEGCDRTCSFCVIPLIRGNYKSRSVRDLVKEARYLAETGVKELILIAQDISYYGLDRNRKSMLYDLVSKLSDIPGLTWIRLHYAYPSNFPVEILSLIKDRDNICKYLDIPLQHASDRMLKLMRRGAGAAKTQDLLDKIRDEVPGISLRTTFLTGHPGEREKDFVQLLDFVRKNRFERLGVFTYSHEEDSFSWKHYKDDVPVRVKEERMNEIMKVQQEISLELNQAKLKKTLTVLIDRKEGDFFIGRTEADSPEVDNEVLIDANKYHLRKGHFCQVVITGADTYDLTGIPVNKKKRQIKSAS
jgi:ribosomal protein S12 methylthiotransferase